ncbi:UDP-D-xylose:L-fucose alpha-1,3-D-xylosyltransferase MGP4 [Morella rubra]|uniref:Glycosyltransferase n=1 Tax=Morella rubra TaxID=262757 RepID=A0A6A1W762_9ROSI|nr:UDP-D-xylose:L-fucose alpha-1,3-D-xylosyltransferase MGP4 [Morella rubra]
MPHFFFSTTRPSLSKWRDYTLAQAASFVAKNGTVIVCAVSQPYLPFLNNWLISISRQKHQDKVLVIAEDYATLYKVNERWPGHAVLVPPAPDAQTAHKFGSQESNNWRLLKLANPFVSQPFLRPIVILKEFHVVQYETTSHPNLHIPQDRIIPAIFFPKGFPVILIGFNVQGFFNFTSRRPRHLLHILELGYNVMYNDVDMVWLGDPFSYLQGNHDVYFTDDMAAVKPLNHSHDLPPPGKKGRTYICSCMVFLRPTTGGKLIMKKWIEELQAQPWSKAKKSNDQPAFNWALNRTAGAVDLYLLPQAAFPSGGLYFKNQTWVQETKGMHVIIHNNYITGFEKKIKRFREFDLWLVDDHSPESPLGRL